MSKAYDSSGFDHKSLDQWDWSDFGHWGKETAIEGAKSALDVIKDEADLFVVWRDDDDDDDDPNGPKLTALVCLDGDSYFLRFNLLDELNDIDNLVPLSMRKSWESELRDAEKLAECFKELSDNLNLKISALRNAGTLDEDLGMTYEQWKTKGRPSIKAAGT